MTSSLLVFCALLFQTRQPDALFEIKRLGLYPRQNVGAYEPQVLQDPFGAAYLAGASFILPIANPRPLPTPVDAVALPKAQP